MLYGLYGTSHLPAVEDTQIGQVASAAPGIGMGMSCGSLHDRPASPSVECPQNIWFSLSPPVASDQIGSPGSSMT